MPTSLIPHRAAGLRKTVVVGHNDWKPDFLNITALVAWSFAMYNNFSAIAGLLIGASIVGVACGEPTRISERPSASALAEATKSIRAVFKDDLANAKTPSEKLKLAKPLLRASTGVRDNDAEYFAMCVLARDLAVEACDTKTACAASLAIAERYRQEKGNPLERGNAAWNLAKSRKGAAQVRMQADAAEWYSYALPFCDGVTRLMIEKRLSGDDLGGKDADLKLLIGTWDVKVGKSRGVWSFRQDGAFLSGQNATEVVGRWIADADKVTVVLTKNPGAWQTFHRPIEATVTGDTRNEAGIIRAQKIESAK